MLQDNEIENERKGLTWERVGCEDDASSLSSSLSSLSSALRLESNPNGEGNRKSTLKILNLSPG